MTTDPNAAGASGDADEPEAITVYSDYVCPFCFLGRSVMAQYRDQRKKPLNVEWHPFDLRSGKRQPDGSINTDIDDGKDEDYYSQARENVRRLQEKYDVEMAQEIRRDVDSWDAQQASLYVREEHPEKWEAFDDAIFEALWTDARDIGSPDVLADLASDIGLHPEEIRDALEDEEWETHLESVHQEASQIGITGVPTFVYDGQAARGAVPPEHLQRLVEGQ
ncbi:DsbA family oxidoreductase [Halorubrum sp. BOL3-1]|uniref:DsbA family oxidoreductase n=1 Tax=Halorubrum sp. BOL3-1 TaxID=2497325 RepID=UPI0010050959|nr:DsbA family oxidoreductase [Halorubrum sp. BOL3-1]QAU13339.1 DsbA family oxidoreductase [Halorubrum sp. BOL3-1]